MYLLSFFDLLICTKWLAMVDLVAASSFADFRIIFKIASLLCLFLKLKMCHSIFEIVALCIHTSFAQNLIRISGSLRNLLTEIEPVEINLTKIAF